VNDLSPKNAALDQLTANCYPDTPELVLAIVAESKNHAAWRPGRAGALRGLAEMNRQVWMRPDEFADWILVQSAAGRKRGETLKPIEKLGMTSKRKLRLIRGDAEVSAVEALACAHVAMNFAMPVEPGDVDAFARWVAATFGGVERLSKFLRITNTQIGDRMRGFDVVGDFRVPRAPEAALIRALHWIARCGPVCPYGEELAVKTWPGQEIQP
jgi:hypothetical protein